MAKEQPVDITNVGSQSSVQHPKSGNQKGQEAKPEETQPSRFSELMGGLTNKVKPSEEKQTPLPKNQDSAEDKQEGFQSRNPKSYATATEEPKKASLKVLEPVARARTLSNGRRELERLENPLILDPTPIEELEEREKAKETMSQSKSARFQQFLEEYL